MKKTNHILKRIVGVGVIALLFYVISSNLFADTSGEMIKQDIPVYCGETGFVFDVSTQSMKESQILVGEARLEGSGIGDIVGILSFGHNAKNNTGTFFMTVPDGGINNESVTCVLGYGMNWKFFDDDGNQIMKQNSLIEIGPDITQD
jgi:hypothetical protein|tara:strand:- start:293 stop:733 length:441 start_codon:yes stop_codon:yes gene_type:complete